MIVLLDTDHFSILQRQHGSTRSVLQARLAQVPVGDIKLSIVSFQEQAQGWLAFIHRARKPEEVLRGFFDLQEMLRHYATFDVLPFDRAALAELAALKQQRIRIGTSDLRIAAIAKANGVTLLSRNLRDFRQVPGLDVEDWTAQEESR